jgi:hypothetical protein
MTSYDSLLGRFAAHVTTRTGYAEEARRRTGTSLFSIDNYVIGALVLAIDDRTSFPEDLGSMPAQLEYALTTEISAWERLHTSLDHFHQARPTPREEGEYAGIVRRYLTHELHLLAIERDLFTSPLIEQYVKQINDTKRLLEEVTL